MSPVSPVFYTVELLRLPFNSKRFKTPSPAQLMTIVNNLNPLKNVVHEISISIIYYSKVQDYTLIEY